MAILTRKFSLKKIMCKIDLISRRNSLFIFLPEGGLIRKSVNIPGYVINDQDSESIKKI